MSRVHLDRIPLDLGSRLLPFGTRLNPGLLFHIHLHAKSQSRFAEKKIEKKRYRVSRLGLRGIIDSLEGAVERLSWHPGGTEWGDYYRETNYSAGAFEQKKQFVGDFVERIRPASVWDLGANTGLFSRVASLKGMPTISFDVDPAAVEKNYLELKRRGEKNILPLVLDMTNPSPSIGWESRERLSISERGPAGAVLALALLHHLALSNNVPLGKIADFFAGIGDTLILEFVPKDDSQVQKLLWSRDDLFPDYTRSRFEDEFRRRFVMLDSRGIPESKRMLYLMKRRAG